LKAIEYWDDNYRLKDMPDAIDAAAFRARKKRRQQILQILGDFLSARGRADHESREKPEETVKENALIDSSG
jgi:hypothetical protein